MHVLVTGATGFIGGHLVRLLKHAGHYVFAVTRQEQAVLPHVDEKIVLDLTEPESFAKLPKNIDAVVHLADGLASQFERRAETVSDQVLLEHVSYTDQFAQWLVQNTSLKHFIYISSLKAMCGEQSNCVVTEDTSAKPVSNYGRAKRLAEFALERIFQEGQANLVILRNPIVHGPGCSSNISRLLRLADSSWPLPFASLQGKRSTISVENFCDVISHVLSCSDEHTHGHNGIYLVADDQALSAGEMISYFRKALGRQVRLFALPRSFWALCSIMPKLGAVTRRFSKSLVLSDAKFRRDFSWQPPITTEQSFENMVQFYREEKCSKLVKLTEQVS